MVVQGERRLFNVHRPGPPGVVVCLWPILMPESPGEQDSGLFSRDECVGQGQGQWPYIHCHVETRLHAGCLVGIGAGLCRLAEDVQPAEDVWMSSRPPAQLS